MPHKVAFDSNTWRKVASPSKFLKDPDMAVYQSIHDACRAGEIIGYLSETTFTLEQIKREERLDWIRSSAHVSVTEKTDNSGVIGFRIEVGPRNVVTPGNISTVKGHLDDALSIGVRVLRSKRIAGPSSPMLNSPAMFVGYASDDEFHKFNELSGEISRELEQRGVGIANIKEFGMANIPKGSGTHWTDGLASLEGTVEEKRKVAEMVAEWADADALATSIAHGAEYFCTNDVATGSTNKGVRSIMLPSIVGTLTDKYGIRFVRPAELVAALSL